jgi:hypothetical protein
MKIFSDVLYHVKTPRSHRSVHETRAVELCYCFDCSTPVSGFDAVVRAGPGGCHHSAVCDLHFSSSSSLGSSDHKLDAAVSDWSAPPAIKAVSWSKYVHNLFKKVILRKNRYKGTLRFTWFPLAGQYLHTGLYRCIIFPSLRHVKHLVCFWKK